MLPPLPRCSGWASSSLVSPNRVSLPRFHFRVGLHIVLFEACSAFTRVAACTLAQSPYVVTAIRRLQTLRLLHVCSGRFRLERSPGGACTHWKSAALSRRTWEADLDVRTDLMRSDLHQLTARQPDARTRHPGQRPRPCGSRGRRHPPRQRLTSNDGAPGREAGWQRPGPAFTPPLVGPGRFGERAGPPGAPRGIDR
jgi:hypothetical protein